MKEEYEILYEARLPGSIQSSQVAKRGDIQCEAAVRKYGAKSQTKAGVSTEGMFTEKGHGTSDGLDAHLAFLF